jgi:hypothetical protein
MDGQKVQQSHAALLSAGGWGSSGIGVFVWRWLLVAVGNLDCVHAVLLDHERCIIIIMLPIKP